MIIKAVTIDFWNTLFDSSNGHNRNAYRQRALIREIDKLGVMVKRDELDEAVRACWMYFDRVWKNEQRTPSPQETIGFFWHHLKLPENEDTVNSIVEEFSTCLLKYPPKIIDGAVDAIKFLSQKFTLGIVSDTGFTPGSILKEIMAAEDIVQYFSIFSFSDETGVAKPNEKAFRVILDEIGCEPEEALHIGDIETTDIAGARQLGMKAIRFRGDPSSVLAVSGDTETMADADAHSWEDVIEYFKTNGFV